MADPRLPAGSTADPGSPAGPVSEPPARPAPGLSCSGPPSSGPPAGPAAESSGSAAEPPGSAAESLGSAAEHPEAAPPRLLPDSWRPLPDGRAELLATRCPRCGTLTFPVVPACPACWNTGGLGAEPVAGPGTVYAFAVVRVAEPGLPVPYRIGYADFPGGLRVCGRFTGPDLGIGDDVEVVTAVLRPPGPRLGWAFRKAGG